MKLKQYEIIKTKNKLKLKVINRIKLKNKVIYNYDNIIDVQMLIMKNAFHLDLYESEHLYVLALDADKHILGVYLLNIGSPSEVDLNNRKMIIFLLLIGASSCVLVHNHPNNENFGSQDDKQSEFGLKLTLKNYDIKFNGLYIITKKGFSNSKGDYSDKWKNIINYNKVDKNVKVTVIKEGTL